MRIQESMMVNEVVARPVGLVLGRLSVGVVPAGRRKRWRPSWFRWSATQSATDQILRLDPVLAVMLRGPR
ncbi:hypothetical protein [Nocardia vinacea]|uniref:hypothetical protein n=1 Tax=Nocardia vinacea TaxID=96468 RepID=UPI0012F6C078|nr:hypothetical protein [Nocardia vinacea]